MTDDKELDSQMRGIIKLAAKATYNSLRVFEPATVGDIATMVMGMAIVISLEPVHYEKAIEAVGRALRVNLAEYTKRFTDQGKEG